MGDRVVIPENTGSIVGENKTLIEALYLLKIYLETYLQKMTIDRMTEKGEEEWLALIANRVEQHIASLNEVE